MTLLYFNDEENAAIEELAAKQGLSCAGVLRQAVRLYQQAHHELEKGNQLGYYNAQGNRVIDKPFGCMGD